MITTRQYGRNTTVKCSNKDMALNTTWCKQQGSVETQTQAVSGFHRTQATSAQSQSAVMQTSTRLQKHQLQGKQMQVQVTRKLNTSAKTQNKQGSL